MKSCKLSYFNRHILNLNGLNGPIIIILLPITFRQLESIGHYRIAEVQWEKLDIFRSPGSSNITHGLPSFKGKLGCVVAAEDLDRAQACNEQKNVSMYW